MKALKEKELENQYNVKQRETADAIKNIKKAAFCVLMFVFISLVVIAIEQFYQPLLSQH